MKESNREAASKLVQEGGDGSTPGRGEGWAGGVGAGAGSGGRQATYPSQRWIVEDAGRSLATYDRAKARSRLGPIPAENREAASKLVQEGGDGSTPDIAYQGRVQGADTLKRTKQAREQG